MYCGSGELLHMVEGREDNPAASIYEGILRPNAP